MSTMGCSRPPYTSATDDAPYHLRAVSGMVGTDGRIHKRPGLPSERNLRAWIAAVLKLRG